MMGSTGSMGTRGSSTILSSSTNIENNSPNQGLKFAVYNNAKDLSSRNSF